MFLALGTETAKPSSAASCIAGIASAELPHNLWPDLMEKLCNNTSAPTSTDAVKEATLEAIGYICQDIVSSNSKEKSVWSRYICGYFQIFIISLSL